MSNWWFRWILLSALVFSTARAPAQRDKGSTSKAPATDGQVWGALIYATDDPDSVPEASQKFPADPADLEVRLRKVFPQETFRVLGQHTQDILREYESWVVPSRDLFLKVDSNGPAKGGGIQLHFQFWQGEQVLLKSDAVLRTDSPLFIGGPKWRKGQLIFVLMLKAER